MRIILLVISHFVVLGFGVGLGIYILPILTEPDGPAEADLIDMASAATYRASFRRDLADSDFFHWGEGEVSISPTQIVHQGALAPGPNYKLYLVPEFVETEDAFDAIKDRSMRVGDINTFEGFILDLPTGTDIEAFNTVLVWCEAFEQFITAAQYR